MEERIPTYSVAPETEVEYGEVIKKTSTSRRKAESGAGGSDVGIKKNFRRIELIVTVQHLIKNSKYNRALEFINELQFLQTNEWERLHTLLMKIECKVQSGRRGIKHDIEAATDLVMALRPSTSDITDVAQEFTTSKNDMRSVVLYIAGIQLCKINLSGDAAVRGIKACVKHTTGIVQNLVKADPSILVVMKESVIPTMVEGIEIIDQITGVTHKAVTEQKARCLYNAGICYRVIGDNGLALKTHEQAVQLLQKEFKDDATKYQVYARCIAGIGHSYKNLRQEEKANEIYHTALAAFEYVTDWTSQEQREKETGTVKQLINK